MHISITGNRLMFHIRCQDGEPVIATQMSLTPFRRIVKDYFMICDSDYQAIRNATPDRIEALDMGRWDRRRRFGHADGAARRQGAHRFRDRRRLFTPLSVLHWKG